MPSSFDRFLRIPADCFSCELNGYLEWLAVEAYMRFLNDQLEDAQRIFREHTENEYIRECNEIRNNSDGSDEDSQELQILKQQYRERKEVEERHIAERAWLSFLPMVWSVFEKQFFLALKWANKRNNTSTRLKLHGNSVDWIKTHIQELHIGAFDADWEYLNGIYILRNTISHVNGYIRELNRIEDQDKLKEFIFKETSICINEDNAVVFGSEFAQESFEKCHATIEEFRRFLFRHLCNPLTS